MKIKYTALSTGFFMAICAVGCMKGGGSGPATPESTNPLTPQTPTSTSASAGGPAPHSSTSVPVGGQGTYSAGGGNGINGKALETYIRQIDALPEYKTYILPMLRKMAIGKPDVLLVYLNWAVHQKPWYFVPVELPTLSKEQIHMLFQTDQLALHAEEGIFIYAPKFEQQSEKDRAALLLHEMVMAARLLMKSSAEVQCQTLSKSTDLGPCKDPEQIKIAIQPPPRPAVSAEHPLLDGLDHEKVRMMTTFLSADGQDFSGQSIFAARLRLGFSFPWDNSISYAGHKDLLAALDRSKHQQDQFVSAAAPAGSVPAVCQLELSDGNSTYNFMSFLLTTAPGATSFAPLTWGTPGVSSTSDQILDSANVMMPASDDAIEAAGVADPHGSGETVDRITMNPYGMWRFSYGTSFSFYITRGKTPHLIEFRVTQVSAVERNLGGSDASFSQIIDYVPVKTAKPSRCVLSN